VSMRSGARRPTSNGSARRPIFPRSGPAVPSRFGKASRRTRRFSPPGTFMGRKVSPSGSSKRSISSNSLMGANVRSRSALRIGARCWARPGSDDLAATASLGAPLPKCVSFRPVNIAVGYCLRRVNIAVAFSK
jgi:hypothetical protein